MGDDPEQPDWRAKPLEYERLDDENPRAGVIVRQAFLGAILVGVQVVVSVLLVVFMFLLFAPFGFLAAIVVLTGIGATLHYAIDNRSEPDKRGWVIGIWLGLGLGLLFEGICFGSMTHI